MKLLIFTVQRMIPLITKALFIIRLGDNPNDNFSMPVSVAKEIINSGELEEDSVFVLLLQPIFKK